MPAPPKGDGPTLIEPGQPAPEIDLTDQEGRLHNLKKYAGQWLVLYFYPRDMTPGCTKEACAFRDATDQFDIRRVAVLGVSPDDEASHAKFAAKHELPFSLLADTDKRVCEAYGVWQEKMNYGKKYMGVVRTTYLIDPNGYVVHRWDKVKVANHEASVLEMVDMMAGT